MVDHNKLVGKLLLIIIVFSLMTPFIVYAGDPPPPPPPPCPTIAQGCYDLSDNKAEAGSLASDSFGFYLSETAYIPGGCSASAGKTVAQAKITNPDDHLNACGCIEGTSFDNQVEVAKRCCGDDTRDCAMVSKGSLCSIDSSFREGSWHFGKDEPGNVVFAGCKKIGR